MKTYFVDTNVLIDFLSQREDYKAAALFLYNAKIGKYKVCTSVLSMANLVYVLRKSLKGEVLYETLRKLSFIDISPMTKEDYSKAIALKANDFEDALQYSSAVSFGCDALVTRNAKDFPFSKIPVMKPSECLF